MGVSKDEVRRIAALAQLRPDESAVERLTAELNGILEHIQRLEEVDLTQAVSGDEGSQRALPIRDPEMEPDLLAPGAPADRAPDWQEGFFVVPRLRALDRDGEGEVAG
ncbi:MAG: Asp-tRNA(Asn)/Glu-tRNA(Gln) amidotransferase subunit GatC [Gemmatimonadota bacterium]